MRTWVGTSGYNYPEWKGSFYPEKMPAAKMLPFYAAAFSTVEINYTFYRVPNEKILAGWSRETPDGFRLTLKAPKRITHIAKLHDCADLLQYFLKTAGTLGPKLGAILFQLPPYFRKDLRGARRVPGAAADRDAARRSSSGTPRGWTRRSSRACGPATSRSASPTARSSPPRSRSRPITAISGCATRATRRRTCAAGRRTIRTSAAACSDVFVYFKHEEAGKGPQFARLLLDALAPS